jgi:hypothetical protein
MAIDYAITLACEPRRHFGDGNVELGTIEILEKLKARDRASTIREFARTKGIDLSGQKVTMNVHDREGNPVQKQVTIAELELEARELETQAAACAGCPANVLGQAYGCYAAIHYPISAAGEAWLTSRVQPPGTLGAMMCADYLSEFGVTGEQTKQLRQAGHFESRQAARAILKKGFLKSVAVTSDQLFEAIFQSGNLLSPSHCLGLLLWFGAVQVEAGANSAEALQALTGTDAVQRRTDGTRLDLGPAPESPGELAFWTFAQAMYLAWVLDVPLYVSA